jgi:hypothetical protein
LRSLRGKLDSNERKGIASCGGFLIGLYIAMLIYPFFEEWQQRRLGQRAPGENAQASRDGPSMGCDERSMYRRIARGEGKIIGRQ